MESFCGPFRPTLDLLLLNKHEGETKALVRRAWTREQTPLRQRKRGGDVPGRPRRVTGVMISLRSCPQ